MRVLVAALIAALALCFLPGGGLLAPETSQAAGSGVKALKAGKTYTVKFAGSKKHTLKYTVTPTPTVDAEPAGWVKIYVDGKKAYSYKFGFPDFVARLYTVKVSARTTLLHFHFTEEDSYSAVEKILRYKGGKLVTAADLTKIADRSSNKKKGAYLSSWTRDARVTKASGGKFTVKWFTQDCVVGMYYATLVYEYSEGKAKRVTNTFKPVFPKAVEGEGKPAWKDNTGTASRAFDAYTAPDGNTVAFSAATGDKIKVAQVKLAKGTRFYNVKNTAGVSGWIKEVELF
ncbi:MAG: hypothetical protein LBR00_05260, partial [Clostridiales Family XIII bacterium]|nr:hypothetical protein [Clostridiales Family XIII bacterium]